MMNLAIATVEQCNAELGDFEQPERNPKKQTHGLRTVGFIKATLQRYSRAYWACSTASEGLALVCESGDSVLEASFKGLEVQVAERCSGPNRRPLCARRRAPATG